MISIIIPTLNEEKYISRLLRDLEQQTMKDFEVIVVDAKSNDKTVQQIKKSPLSIKIIESPVRCSAFQKNLGAMHANYRILIFFDADITVKNPHFLSRINLKKSIAGFTPVFVSGAGLRDMLFIHPLNALLRIGNMLSSIGARGGCQVVKRKEFMEIGGFNERLAVSEDIDLFLRLAKKGRIAYFSMPVYESPRRYRKIGYLNTFLLWAVNGLWAACFGRSFSKQWRPIR